MISKSGVVVLALVSGAVWGVRSAVSEEPKAQGKETGLTANTVNWNSCGVPEFPGCEAAVLYGDPAQGASDIYVKIPAGGSFPPHWHSNPHYFVGIAGNLTFVRKDGSLLTLAPGTFGYWPGAELMRGQCSNDGPCIYYDHQDKYADVHFPMGEHHHGEGAAAGSQAGAATITGAAETH